jgi:D-aminoacyl-tRNA deacylase
VLRGEVERGAEVERSRREGAVLRAVVQRVAAAQVIVAGEPVGEVGHGLCVLLGVAATDDEDLAERLAGKVARVRIFENDEGKFDRSVLDVHGGVLVVSQFTLIADSRRQKGTRPDFSKAARPEVAEPLYDLFCQTLRDCGLDVETGVFGARMAVELVNDGPVTIILEA